MFVIMKSYKDIKSDIDYLFSKINWGASFMDAKAIEIMNSLPESIRTMQKSCICTPDETTGSIQTQCCNVCGGNQELCAECDEQPIDYNYSPCCSKDCWHKRYVVTKDHFNKEQ